MYFELLGSSSGLSNVEQSKTKLEIAVAGTALPIMLSLEPPALEFSTAYIGQKREKTIHIYNQSDYKSIRFRFPSIANFAVQPASGKLKSREKLKVTVTFIPHQMGRRMPKLAPRFRRSPSLLLYSGDISKTLVCEVLGGVVNADAPVYTQSKPIHQTQCQLTGHAVIITEMPTEKFNMGT